MVDGKQAVLLIGNFRPTLAAVRALGRLGYLVYVAAEPGSSGAEHSRFLDKLLPIPAPQEGVGAFRTALLDCLGKHPEIAFLLPMRESTIELLDACRDSVPEGIHLATPAHNALEICLDKLTWLKFCRDIGMPCPPFGFASNLEELKKVVEEIGGTVVIRPVEAGKRIWHRKAITLESPAELETAFPEWPSDLSELLIQRHFYGGRYNIQFAAKDGRVIAGQHSFSTRTDRIDGTGQTIEGKTVPPLAIHDRMLDLAVGAMNYSGVGNAQFLHNEASGESCFLEINPRFGASLSYSERSGFNMTELALQISDPACEPRPAPSFKQVSFVWTYGDLHGLTFSLKAGDLTRAQALGWVLASLRAAVLSDVHITWSWRDPWPTVVIYSKRLLSALGLPTG
jgi:predicted ATP-grasp superfamily ATP-dependent carboligase